MAEAPERACEGETFLAEDGPSAPGSAELGAGQGAYAHPVVGQNLVEAARRAARPKEREPEGIVLAQKKGGHLHLAEAGRVVDGGEAADDVMSEQGGVVDCRRGVDDEEIASGSVLAAVGGEAEGRQLGLHEGELAGELLRPPAVVRIKEGEEAAAGGVDGTVAGGGGAPAMSREAARGGSGCAGRG